MSRRLLSVSALLSLLCLLVAGAPAYAAADPSPTLHPGANALVFSINDDFQLGAFSGNTLSLKHHVSARSAWRLGASVQVLANSTDDIRIYSMPDSVLTRTEEQDRLGLGLEATWLRYSRPGARVSAYYGAGPVVSLSRIDNETTWPNGESRRMEIRRTSIGAAFVLGGEWFVARALGIHAEYGLSIVHTDETVEDTPPPSSGASASRQEFSSWSAQGNDVRFGASWYF
jgi:hypothetical protein